LSNDATVQNEAVLGATRTLSAAYGSAAGLLIADSMEAAGKK
jgi:hypothetical protein